MNLSIIDHSVPTMIRRVTLVAALVVSLPVPLSAETGVDASADTTDAVDVSDDATGDAVADAASDTGDAVADGTSDTGDAVADTASDTGISGDAAADASADGEVAGDVAATDDARDGASDGGADTPGAGLRFEGNVDVHGGLDRGVLVTLKRRSGEGRWERTTDTSGDFVFDGIGAGRYRVRVQKDGFSTVTETFELDGDRWVQYDLFEDREVDFRLVVSFAGGAPYPDCIEARLEGPRGTVRPESALSVEGGAAGDGGSGRSAPRAVWEVSSVGVGDWTLHAAPTAAGSECSPEAVDRWGAVDVPVDLERRDGVQRGLEMRVELPARDLGPASSPSSSGCRAVSPGRPSPPVALCLLLFGCWIRRERGR